MIALPLLTTAHIEQLACSLSQTAAHPNTIQELLSVRRASAREKYEHARAVARTENLAAKNIPMPGDFRITTRSFEDPRLFRMQQHLQGTTDDPIVYFEDDHGVCCLTTLQ